MNTQTVKREALKEVGMSEALYEQIQTNNRLLEALDRHGLGSDSKIRKEHPSIILRTLESKFGAEKRRHAEQVLGAIKRNKYKVAATSLRESLSADVFDFLLTSNLNASLATPFEEEALSEIEKFVNVTDDVDTYQQQQVNRINSFATMDSLDATGRKYLELSRPGENQVTFTVSRYGNILSYELEAEANDTLDYFSDMGTKLRQAADRRILTEVFNTGISANPSLAGSDTNSLFDNTNHVNDPNGGTVVGLTYSSLEKVWNSFRGATDSGSQVIDTGGKFNILTGIDNEIQALQLMDSEKIPETSSNAANIFRNKINDVIVSRHFNTDTFWSLVADKKLIETFRLAYFEGHRNPIVTQLTDDESTKSLRWRIEQDAKFVPLTYQGCHRGSA